MTRIKRGVTKRHRHKKVLRMTSGHRAGRHALYKRAHESLIHALRYAYFHRREKKGDMRRLWNIRINAEARVNGISYSQLVHGLKLAGVEVNRKMLADLAIRDSGAFAQIGDPREGADRRLRGVVSPHSLCPPIRRRVPEVMCSEGPRDASRQPALRCPPGPAISEPGRRVPTSTSGVRRERALPARRAASAPLS